MAFESRVVAADPSQYKTPFLAVLVPRGDLPASLAALDKATSGALGRAYKSGDFTKIGTAQSKLQQLLQQYESQYGSPTRSPTPSPSRTR